MISLDLMESSEVRKAGDPLCPLCPLSSTLLPLIFPSKIFRTYTLCYLAQGLLEVPLFLKWLFVKEKLTPTPTNEKTHLFKVCTLKTRCSEFGCQTLFVH